MEKISVIVPIYNAEKYLSKCLDSIIKQTYSCLEIILIDDGSTDSSYKIMENYKKKDNRIILFREENSGVSSARNLGIKKMTGEYITFVDSDDWIDADYLEKMYKIIKETKSDFVKTGYTVNHNYEEGKTNYFFDDSIKEIEKEKIVDYFLTNSYLNSSCMQLISKKILDRNEILFNENFIYGEDMLFTFQVMQHANKRIWLKNAGYHCYSNSDSITRQINSEVCINKCNDSYYTYQNFYSYTDDRNLVSSVIYSKINSNLFTYIKCSNCNYHDFLSMINDISFENFKNLDLYFNSRYMKNPIKYFLVNLLKKKKYKKYFYLLKAYSMLKH